MLTFKDAEVAEGIRLRVVVSDAGVRSILFEPWPDAEDACAGATTLLDETARQLRSFFARELRAFDLPLDPRGTEFQLRVWRDLLRIRYGETRSYRQVAEAIGSPGSVRAVGAANGANPIPIVVPCHRVIGSDGSLTGYGGGLDLKRRLLELEGTLPLTLDY
jgi:methylated-DNA-[protein]-cysteine S-methyltransferase